MSVTYYLTNVCIDALYWPALWTLTLQAKQQRHERDLYELKIKAEREALETQLQMEENRQRVARVLLWHTQFIRSPTIYISLSYLSFYFSVCMILDPGSNRNTGKLGRSSKRDFGGTPGSNYKDDESTGWGSAVHSRHCPTHQGG